MYLESQSTDSASEWFEVFEMSCSTIYLIWPKENMSNPCPNLLSRDCLCRWDTHYPSPLSVCPPLSLQYCRSYLSTLLCAAVIWTLLCVFLVSRNCILQVSSKKLRQPYFLLSYPTKCWKINSECPLHKYYVQQKFLLNSMQLLIYKWPGELILMFLNGSVGTVFM